jgi:organic hydroperoxide reductase OsmC/OhrA
MARTGQDARRTTCWVVEPKSMRSDDVQHGGLRVVPAGQARGVVERPMGDVGQVDRTGNAFNADHGHTPHPPVEQSPFRPSRPLAPFVQRRAPRRALTVAARKESAMPAPFPHHYDVRLSTTGESSVLGGGHRPDIVGGPPVEFDGSDRWWSPEHLLLSAVALCFTTTFQAFAARARLQVVQFRAQAHGVLDKTTGGLGFTSIRLAVDLQVDGADRARTEQLLQKAKRHCIVANALKTPVELEVLLDAAETAVVTHQLI